MRGLLAIECLYHQIVAGRKTQTRRSGGLEQVNGQKATKKKPAIISNPDDWELVRFNSNHAKFWKKNDALKEVYCKPSYRVGEVLYLKEPTMLFSCPVSEKERVVYKYELMGDLDLRINGKWSNKLFMPASDARAFIKITGIRCERLLDISDADCIAEGIEYSDLPGGYTERCYKRYGVTNAWLIKPKDSFISLYKFANKVKEVPNIFVWVYEIEYLKGYKS